MLLNRFEKAMMNNPARALIQRHYELPKLLRMGGPLRPDAFVLEIGGGRGVGTELLLTRFDSAKVTAIDLDPHMVRLARRRLAPFGERASVRVADATSLPFEDDSFDAVFDFGIIHHVPNWRAALDEVHRVLRPGGRLYAEEVLEAFILNPVWRRLLAHPIEDRFDRAGFARAVDRAGLRLATTDQLGTWFAWLIADKPLRAG